MPSVNLQDRIGGGCCGYDPNIAADAVNNAVTVAWYSNSSSAPGIWSQALDPASGNPTGEPVRMPGSVTTLDGQEESIAIDHRVPLATLQTGGFFVAYPSGYPSADKVLVWQVGATTARKVGTNNVASLTGTTISATGDNRLWVAWSANAGGVRRIVARRSNAGASKWGQAVTVKPPPGTSSFWSLYGEANPSGVLDALAVVTTPAGLATWHSQVEPGLTITGPATFKKNKKTKAVFKVTDAGDPVAGATVKSAGKTGKTGADGKVTLKLGPFGKKAKFVFAKASLDGYASGTVAVKVKKK